MKNSNTTATEKATYIVNTVKSVGKTLDYAIDIVSWYTMTDREEKEVISLMKQNW